MDKVLLINDKSESKSLLIKSLEAAGFEIISVENGLISVDLPQDKLTSIEESKDSHTLNSIFPPIPRLHEVFGFIESNYHQSIKLKEVAQAVGYSSAYLTDLVRRMTGKTVNYWIVERRMVEAKRLLSQTDNSIEEIAVKVGYKNTNHFYCQFRKFYQSTPASCRVS